MLNFFKKKKNAGAEAINYGFKLDVATLNQNCVECQNCGTKMQIENMKPLVIDKCKLCGNPIFVPLKVKNFWLFQPLGGGGMGSVYKAVYDSGGPGFFAVKILSRASKNNQHLIHALLNEAAIAKSFGKHPHLIPVIDYGNCGDEYYSAMEFVDGKRLDQIIEEKIPVSQKFAILWGLQLLSAEQRIYDRGYLYRDMKPQNIIIDKNKNVKLFDYGLCTPIEVAEKINSSETVEGSPIYMPPERIIGHPEAMNSEIYSIGMVLFHLLSGKPYYSSSDAYNLAKKHVTSIRVANVASRMPKNISTSISNLIDKMIARNPQERFQTYKEVAFEMSKIFNSLK